MDGSPGLLRIVVVLMVMTSLSLLFSVTGTEGQTTSITSSGLGTTISPPSIDPAGRPNYTITGGTRPGDGPNLFHSFGDFSVGTNNVARFFNETGRDTTNILSRVTGGQPSNIYGTIQTTGFKAAALWLINPAGIVFGPTASLNVGGSVHFSTADYLRLGSGNDRFYADLGKTSQLTSAPVTAFGFLGSSAAGTISVQGGTVQGGQTLSLVGRDRTVGDTVTPGIEVTGGTFSNPGGRINLISVGTPQNPSAGGEINATDFNPSPTLGFSNMGGIALSNGATVHTNASSAGSIFVRGGQLVLDGGSSIQVKTVDGASGDIDIQVASDVTLKNGAFLATETSGSGNGGNVTVKSANLFLENQTTIDSFSNKGGGRGGDITLQVTGDVSLKNSWLATGTVGSGDAGHLMITSRNIGITDNSFLLTTTFPVTDKNSTTTGKGGNISMQASDNVSLSAATIQSDTQGAGDGGNVRITARDISLSSNSEVTAGTSSTGKVGNISIAATNGVTISGSKIERSSSDAGDTGNVTITTPGTVKLTDSATITTSGNAAGPIFIRGGDLILSDFSEIKADTRNQAGGNIDIKANTVELVRGGIISAVSSGSGRGGDILISADNLTLSATPGGTNTIITQASASGNAGNITLDASSITLGVKELAAIRASTVSSGSAGNISLQVDKLNIGPADLDASSYSPAVNAGSAGNITIQGRGGSESFAERVTMDGASFMTSAALAPSGNIAIAANEINILSNNAFSTPGTQAGIITLTAPVLNLEGTVSAVAPESGTAGSIIMNVEKANMTNGFIDSRGLGSANAGSIVIQGLNGKGTLAESIVAKGGFGEILTQADSGTGGSISLNAKQISLENVKVSATVTGGTDSTRAPADIIVTAGSFAMNGGAITAETNGAAPGGNITLNVAGPITLTNSATVSSNSTSASTSAGSAGQITIQGLNGAGSSAQTLALDNSTISTTISGGTAASTSATIDVAAEAISLANGALIKADTSGAARGGGINLSSANDIVLTNSMLSTSASQSSGGDIKLTAPNMVLLRDSQISTSVTGGAGSGGDIMIARQFEVLENNQILAQPTQFAVLRNSNILAQANQGSGGAIFLVAGVLLSDPASVINADSKNQTLNGTVNIQAPIQQLSGAIAPLPQAFAVATNLYGQRCATQKGGQFSSFVEGARDGVPPQPGDLIPSPLLLESEGISPSLASQSSPNLAAVRLGLPDFYHPAPVTFLLSTGCRS